MTDKTYELARQELKKYRFQADFLLKKELPAFEIRSKNGSITIAAPNSLELLYGVYDLAEKVGGTKQKQLANMENKLTVIKGEKGQEIN